jgi:hypothetical protein
LKFELQRQNAVENDAAKKFWLGMEQALKARFKIKPPHSPVDAKKYQTASLRTE